MRIIFPVLLSVLFSVCSFSQSYIFKKYSIDEGLSQSQVRCMFQDSRGYLWSGTDAGGICRFDGQSFITYSVEDGLSNSRVFSVIEGDNGYLWIGTEKGVNILNGEHFIPVPEPFGKIAANKISSLFGDSQGRLWIAADSNMYRWNGSLLEKVKELEGIAVNFIYEDSKKNIWFATPANGAIKLENSEFKTFTTENGLPDNNIWTICEGQQGEFWFGTEKGIGRFNAAGSLMNTDLVGFRIRALIKDKNGSIWAGTSANGAYKFEGDNFIPFTSKQGLPIDGIWSMVEDREGNIWFGTDGAGIIRYSSAVFSRITEKEGLINNTVLSLCKDSKGNWWFGSDIGASKFMPGNKEGNFYTYNGSNGFTNDKVWSIIEDTKGAIWLSSYGHGVFRYNGNTFTNYNETNGLSSNNVRCIFEDSKHTIWIGTAKGLNKFNDGKFEIYNEKHGLKNSRILAVLEDAKGNLWFGTSAGGISKLNNNELEKKFISFTDKEGLVNNAVLSIAEDKDGNIWCGTFGGVSKIDPRTNKISNITVRNGLKSNSVYIIVYHDGNLFAGTNNGIDKLDVNEYNKSGKVILKHYGKEECFTGVECNTNAQFIDNRKDIWFGTMMGAIKYDPSQDKLNNTAPITHITNIRLFFENFDWLPYSNSLDSITELPRDLILPYDKNHLTFDFLGISTTIPEKTQYTFMLKGFDKDWFPSTKQSFVTYSYLPPGKYTFMVRAMNNDGVWNQNPVEFSFVIKSPFWQTWWFYTLCILIIIFSIFSLFKIRMQTLRRRAKNLQEQVDLKTMELRGEKEKVEEQHKIIAKKNQNITASINYARRIQNSVLPIKENITKIIPETFVFIKPKDIVSGDFCWFTEINKNGNSEDKLTLIAAIDCTGHGIPGAFMSLVGNSLLNDVIHIKGISNPSRILEKLHEEIIVTLKKEEKDSATVDGMDVSLCVIDRKNKVLEFASTGQPLVLVKNGHTEVIRSGKYPIGLVLKKERQYETYRFSLEEKDTFYIFSDGYTDQFGGPDDEKFSETRFEKLLSNIHHLDLQEQEKIVASTLDDWKGNKPQLDDILVIGMRAT